MNSSVDGAKAEFERERRLIDQMTTMQSRLRDEASMVGTAMACLVVILSLIGVAFAFAGGGVSVTLVGVSAKRSTWLGWLAFGTAALSFVELVLNPRGAAHGRREAVRSLAALKAEYRVPLPEGGEVDRATLLRERYVQVMDALPPIPERSFNRLKAYHLRKVEVSRVLSEQPGISARHARRLVAKRSRDTKQ